jgi:hypothetical protein
MNIFEEVEKLNLPKGEFMVLGSGILAALGIREVGDIDLLVKPALFDKLKEEGWGYEVVEIEGRMREKVSKGIVEAYRDFWWEGGSLEPEEGIAMALKINGVAFLPLETLLEIKKAMKREKDIKDVALIEEYIKNKTPSSLI